MKPRRQQTEDKMSKNLETTNNIIERQRSFGLHQHIYSLCQFLEKESKDREDAS